MPRILVAEDNAEIRGLIQQILQKDGYEIDTASDGGQAIKRIAGTHYDAILLDFMMPVASGFDVIDWIEKNRPELARACVIVITAALRELSRFEEHKVFATLRKPFDVVELRTTVKRCVESRPHPDH